ncbi:MAG: hypothetical protein KJP26_01515 [Maribacter sp.]|nr:hypothetical protein [Maribacter sp.]NNK17974.1 hypothetical protein [Maribacter sp.]
MTNNVTTKPPAWFWVVSVVALIWNLLGAMAYLAEAFITDEMKAAMPADQLELMENTPAWATAAFAIAVWGGVLGCIGLLLRKKWARPVLVVSLLGILVQMSYFFFMTNAAEVYGAAQGVIMPVLFILIAVGLVLFAKTAQKKGWIS